MKSGGSQDGTRMRDATEVLSVLGKSGTHGISVLCHHGAGQPSFVAALIRVLNDGANPRAHLRIRCRPQQVAVPFIGFSGLMDEQFDATDFAAVMRVLDGHIGSITGSEGGRVVVIVEDGQFLDAESAYVLTQMVLAQRIGLVLCCTRSLSGLPNLEPLTALGQLATVELGPLTPPQTARELHLAFGSPPTAGSVAAVQGLTGGIYELVTLVIDVIRERGSWDRVAGHALIRAEHLFEDNEIHGRVWRYLRELEDRELEIVVGVALAGGCSAQRLHEIYPDDEQLLVRGGILVARPGGEFDVVSRLMVMAIRRSAPPSLSRRLFDARESSVEGAGLCNWPMIWWALSVGAVVTEEELTAAAGQANDETEYGFGLELSGADIGTKASMSRSIQRLRAMGGQGHVLECAAGLESLSVKAMTPSEVEEITAAWMLMLAFSYGEVSQYRHAAGAWRHIALSSAGKESMALAKRIELVDVLSAQLEPADWSEELAEVFSGSIPADVQLIGVLAGLENLLWTVQDIRVQSVLERLPQTGAVGLRLRLHAAATLAQMFGGKAELEQAQPEFALPGHSNLPRAHAAVLNLRKAWEEDWKDDIQGSVDGFTQAAADFSALGMSQLAHYCATNAVLRQPALGEEVGFAALLDSVVDILNVGPAIYRQNSMLHQLAVCHADAAALGQEVARLLDTADPRFAIQAVWHVYRNFGEAGRNIVLSEPGRIGELAERLSSGVYGVIGVLLAAAGADDLTRVKDLILKEMRCTGIANVAWASVLLSERASERDVTNARKHLYSRSGRGKSSQIVLASLERRGISGREFEIASHAASGMSNKQISAQMNLSIRTVEGHLYRSFQKLGIQHRDELNALAGILSPR